MLIRGYRLIACAMSWAVFGLAIGIAPAQSQTPCGPAFVGNPNFCHEAATLALVPPSPPATGLQKDRQGNPLPSPGYPTRMPFIFLCTDAFTGQLLDCGYSVEIVKVLDSTSAPNGANGGHIAEKHLAVRPLIEPKDGTLIFSGSSPSSGIISNSPGTPPKMTGRTGHSVAVVLYSVPQASGDLLAELFVVSPPGYLCEDPGCFDQVPFRFGLNRMKFLTTIRVGIPIPAPLCLFCPPSPGVFEELIQTPDTPFVLTGAAPPHPGNHFGAATALSLITRIAQAYREINPDLGKLGINDISLIRGGVYDLSTQWFADNTSGNGHWGHRTGTEVDIDRHDSNNNTTACESIDGGNDRVEWAVLAIIPEDLVPTAPQGTIPLAARSAYRCEPGGRNHVYLQ